MTAGREASIRLRPLATGDAALYAALYGDAETMRHVGPRLDADACGRSFAAALRANAATPPSARTRVVCDSSDDRGFGLAGLRWDGQGGAELGVVLPPSRQGRGHASATIRAICGPAFADYGLQRLHTRHDPGHALAAGLMATLGFTCTDAGGDGRPRRWQLRNPALSPETGPR